MHTLFETMRPQALFAIGLSLLLSSSVTAGVTILPGLGPDYWELSDSIEQSVATAINNAGVVVGSTGSNPQLSGEGAAVRWIDGAIDVLPRFPDAAPNGSSFGAADVSDTGVIVGFSSYPTPENRWAAHAAKWTVDGIVDLGTLPGHDSSFAAAINTTGEVAGSSELGFFLDRERLPVRWSAVGQISPLGLLPTQDPLLVQSGQVMHDRGGVSDINDAGRIVGYSELFGGDNPQELLPVYWDNVEPVALPLPAGFNYGNTAGINDSGQVVGSIASFAAFNFSSYQAAIWSDVSSEPQILSLPEDLTFGFATGVNSHGQVIGGATNDSFLVKYGYATNVLLWEPDGSVIDLTPRLEAAFPGETNFYLTEINDFGQISGYISGQYGVRNGFAFVLTIPEPSTLCIIMGVFTTLAIRRIENRSPRT